MRFWVIVIVVNFLKKRGLWRMHPVKIEGVHPDVIFIEKYKAKFMALYESKRAILNGNMLDIYYNKTELIDNELDSYCTIWKTRNIVLTTPYGNIGMYYDLNHRGFCYYSDKKDIPHDILNAVSMHYVLTYFCLDFYIDNTMIPNWISPFWEVWDKPSDDEKPTKPFIERLPDVNGDIHNKMNKINKMILPKFKKYKLYLETNKDKDMRMDYNKNKFLYMGKIIDMSFFCIVKKKKIVFETTKKLSFLEYRQQLLLNGGVGSSDSSGGTGGDNDSDDREFGGYGGGICGGGDCVTGGDDCVTEWR